LAVAVI